VHAVRRHILEILKERNGGTVAELAESLDMAPVSVRHHLDILQADNLIRVGRLERSGAVGRPQQVYLLTNEASDYFPNNFAALAGNLVQQVKQVLSQEQVDAVFCHMARDLASEFAPEECVSAEVLVERVAEFLNARGYLASWEEEESGGTWLIHKHNCPYSGVSSEHHELCLMDQTLVNTLFGQECQRVAHMGSEDSCCTYRVHLSGDNTASCAETVRSPIVLVS
jgi:predicted ArsR family transcriptional regulator